MRLFIGIDLPDQSKQHIHDYLQPIKQSPKGWEHPHDYHQTLLFIGEASVQECSDIKERMKSITFPSFELTSDGFKFFNRRIMYLAFKNSPKLLQLRTEVERNFSEWLRPAAKDFIPHVTVKRWQRYEYDYLHKNINEKLFSDVSFRVNKLSLFLSQKDELNRKYHVIFRSNLSKS